MNCKQRLRQSICALVVSAAFFSAPARASDMGMAAADQVSVASYYDFMDNWLFTHIGDNRGPSGPDLIPCRDNIQDLMESYGLSVVLEPFSYSSTTYHNVVGTMVGTVYPDREYIIGAHYDSVSNPGADDNASGVALVLECARILSQYESECTIRFVAFSMEEVGLVGSSAYVNAHWADDIRGMISADMVAYDPNTNDCNIYGRTSSSPIKNTLAAAVAEYGDGLTYTIGGDTPYSDHAPFEQAGYQACLLIEGEVWSNPFYHKQTDSFEQPGNLNFPYAVKMTRSVAGWLVDQAGVMIRKLVFEYPSDLPEFSMPIGGTTIDVQITGVGSSVPEPGTGLLHYNTGGGWEAVPMAELSPNAYLATLPPATCGDVLTYYFSAENTLGEVVTDPFNAPTATYSARVAYGREAFFEELLEGDPFWSTEEDWAFGQPMGQGGQHGGPDPSGGYTGDFVYGYNLEGDYPSLLLPKHLTSPPIDCTGRYDVKLSFWRWLGVEHPDYDRASVRASTDGQTWALVWRNLEEVADTAWQAMEYDISGIADDQPTLYLRWTMGNTDGSMNYCGWNIDDIRLTALQCTLPFVLGDMNCDAQADFGDINPFVLALVDPDRYNVQYPDCDRLRGDFDDNGQCGFEDINPFVDLMLGP